MPSSDRQTVDTPVDLPQRSNLALGPRPRTWRVILYIGVETVSTLGVEVSGQLTVGRADSQEGYVPAIDLGPYGALDAGVSRRHAILFSAEGGIYVRDQGSTNGTRINGFDLEPNQAYKLHEGDRLEFGHVQIQFHVVGAPGPRAS
jgi:pSer/pThr/pTyr-binding forkhead associated (FHA) protein